MISNVLKMWRKINRWLKALTVILLVQFGGLPQMKLGYYCNDPSISHKYTGDTISWKFVLAIAALFPLIFLYAVEALQNRNEYTKIGNLFPRKSILWKLYVEYAYGLLLDIALVQVVKVVVGEPRPHFFDVCKPNTQCEESEYVASYTCTNPLYSDIRKADAGRSFPSGHTSIGIHAAVFLVWYLHNMRTPSIHSKINVIIPIAQAFFLLLSVYCGISRITDRRHHWWDVVAGAALGVIIVVYTIQYKCKNIECLTSRSTAEEIEQTILHGNGSHIHTSSSNGSGYSKIEERNL